MFRPIACLLAVGALLLLPPAATSQEEGTPEVYAYSTYSQCDLTGQWLADAIDEHLFTPAFNAAVDDGTIMSWGYLAHHTGGKWRRVRYHTGPSLKAVLDALDTIYDKIEETNAQAAGQYSKICSSHDDYIWRLIAASAPGEEALADRGKYGFSVYFICDESKEQRADQVFEESFAPVYDRWVADGKLASWAFFEHWVGGKYRRLATMTAGDLDSLLEARDGAIGELVEKHTEAMEEFSSICNSHQDYIWEIVRETP